MGDGVAVPEVDDISFVQKSLAANSMSPRCCTLFVTPSLLYPLSSSLGPGILEGVAANPT